MAPASTTDAAQRDALLAGIEADAVREAESIRNK